jgi:enoyl-CoA hydratase/carnithine racemase
MGEDGMDRVTVTLADGVADVRMNRPEKLNALDAAMFGALAAAGEQLRSDRSVRAVVLSGEGRAFCAGLDFASFADMAAGRFHSGTGAVEPDGEHGPSPSPSPSRVPEPPGDVLGRGQRAVFVWQQLDVPVIAAVHGFAYGGGLQLALGADIRHVHPEASLSVMEIKWGLVPDMCGTLLLPALVGVSMAKELTWTGRVLSGEEAASIGLATGVSEQPRETALELAADLATRNPQALRLSKQLFNAGMRAQARQQLAAEQAAIGQLIGSANQVEAVRAQLEKRPAVFRDP